MGESNITFSNQKHQVIILSPKPVGDHTGLYIILLLSTLLFILVSYLLYNFILFKRYSWSIKAKKNALLNSTEQLNDRLSIILSQPVVPKMTLRAHSYGELSNSKYQTPLRTATSLSLYPNFGQKKSFIRNQQYEFPKRLVSDL